MTDVLDPPPVLMTAPPADVLRAGVASEAAAYVYDLARVRAQCKRVASAIPTRKRLFFATMANDHPAVLATVRDSGFGAFVNSPRHFALVLDLGFPPSKVVYAASNMSAAEMGGVLEVGANLVLDSLGQLASLAPVGRGAAVGLRVNVGTALHSPSIEPDPSYRFGILPEELADAVRLASRAGIRIVGAHSYFGTDVMQPAVLVEGLRRLGETAAVLPDLEYLDVGGGFGVPDDLGGAEFNLEEYGTGAGAAVAALEARLDRAVEMFVEPGRYLTATAAYFFVKAVDRKARADRVFIGTNGSVAVFPRMLLYPDRARHPCQVVGAEDRPDHDLPIWVCGNSTYSQDFLARGIRLPLPEPGDTLVFHNAGAYGRSMISNFLGRERPEEILLDSGG